MFFVDLSDILINIKLGLQRFLQGLSFASTFISFYWSLTSPSQILDQILDKLRITIPDS